MSYTVEACEASVFVCCKAKSVPSVVSQHRESSVCVCVCVASLALGVASCVASLEDLAYACLATSTSIVN